MTIQHIRGFTRISDAAASDVVCDAAHVAEGWEEREAEVAGRCLKVICMCEPPPRDCEVVREAARVAFIFLPRQAEQEIRMEGEGASVLERSRKRKIHDALDNGSSPGSGPAKKSESVPKRARTWSENLWQWRARPHRSEDAVDSRRKWATVTWRSDALQQLQPAIIRTRWAVAMVPAQLLGLTVPDTNRQRVFAENAQMNGDRIAALGMPRIRCDLPSCCGGDVESLPLWEVWRENELMFAAAAGLTNQTPS